MTAFDSLIQPSDLDTLCELARSSPPGDIMEVGVYKGGSAHRLYEVCEEQGRTLHLFDTFQGHPEVDHDRDMVSTHYQGRYADAISPRALQAALPNALIYVGEFPATLPPDLSNIAFVHSDVDLYAPTKAVCTLLPSRMVANGLLYFDDYGYSECPGVGQAIIETFGNAHPHRNGKSLIQVNR